MTSTSTKYVHQIIYHIKIHPAKTGHKWTHDPFLMLLVLADPGCPGQVLESHKQFCACMLMCPIKPDKQNNISSPCFNQLHQSLLRLMICHTHRNSLFSSQWESQFATDSPVTGHRKIFWLMSQCSGAITVRIVILLKQRLAVISTVNFIYTCVSV